MSSSPTSTSRAGDLDRGVELRLELGVDLERGGVAKAGGRLVGCRGGASGLRDRAVRPVTGSTVRPAARLRVPVGGGELGLVRHRLDARLTGRAQLLLGERVLVGAVDQRAEHLGAHLRLVALLDDGEGHLAGSEPVQAGRLAEAPEALVDGTLDVVGGQRDGQSTLQAPGGLYGYLHACLVGPPRPGRAGGGHCSGKREGRAREEPDREPDTEAVVRKERLELSRLATPAPKAGASTDSATFAHGTTPRGAHQRRL